jgi:hypothetical protein
MAEHGNKRVEDLLRVTLHASEISSLMERYPKLARTEIVDVVTRVGPMRKDVERELARLSGAKR